MAVLTVFSLHELDVLQMRKLRHREGGYLSKVTGLFPTFLNIRAAARTHVQAVSSESGGLVSVGRDGKPYSSSHSLELWLRSIPVKLPQNCRSETNCFCYLFRGLHIISFGTLSWLHGKRNNCLFKGKNSPFVFQMDTIFVHFTHDSGGVFFKK